MTRKSTINKSVVLFMAIYRNLHISFWTDNKVEDDFTPEDKYFYAYLLTNPQTNICGCYEVSFNQMSHHTGYTKDTISRLIRRFENVHGVIRYCAETKEVLILKWYKYNWSKSEKTLVGVENVAKHIKSDDFRRYVMDTVNKVRGGADDCQTEEEPKNVPSVSAKKVSSADMLNDMVSEFAISDYLLESVQDWIAYKGERNFKYKERGLRTLLKTISEKSTQYGDTAVSTAINESISSGYQGIVWEKIGKTSSSDINWNF